MFFSVDKRAKYHEAHAPRPSKGPGGVPCNPRFCPISRLAAPTPLPPPRRITAGYDRRPCLSRLKPPSMAVSPMRRACVRRLQGRPTPCSSHYFHCLSSRNIKRRGYVARWLPIRVLTLARITGCRARRRCQGQPAREGRLRRDKQGRLS